MNKGVKFRIYPDKEQDYCEVGYDLFDFSDLVIISEFNLMDVPIVSNFDLISALNKLEGDQKEKLISSL